MPLPATRISPISRPTRWCWKFPVLNASVDGSDIIYHEYYDIGVAVSTDRGLIVPIVRDADAKSFAVIEKEVADYARKAREGSLAIEDLTSATFGGTCLNAGCIPSKALLESTELYHRVHEEFAVHGIKVSGATLDLAQMQKRKGGIVRGMTQGILALFKAAGVTALQGHGRLLAGRRVEFTAHDGARRELSARHVVLASGSIPIELRSAPFAARV